MTYEGEHNHPKPTVLTGRSTSIAAMEQAAVHSVAGQGHPQLMSRQSN